jgi:hypothetical protein
MFNQTKEVTFMKNQSTDTLTGKSKISTALFVIFASIAITILLLGNANKGYASTANSLPNKSQSKFMVTRGDPACGPDVYLPAITSNSSWWEMEPNNSIESANGPLLSGYVYFGYPDAAGIGDFYFLDMDIDGQITIQLSDYDVPGGQLQLFDAQRNQVGFDQEPPFHIEYAGSAGRYYVRIVASSAPDRQQRYSLRATYPSPQLPQLYFSDDFCGDSIDTEFWLVDEGDLSYFSVQDGRLKTSSQPITNCDQGWCQHMLNDLGIDSSPSGARRAQRNAPPPRSTSSTSAAWSATPPRPRTLPANASPSSAAPPSRSRRPGLGRRLVQGGHFAWEYKGKHGPR